jgi:ABC-2 type transport system ATP-binding protein
VRELRSQGATVVLTTHAMDEAEQLCDRLAIIDHGRMVGYGTPGELAAAHTVEETRFSAPPDLDRAALAAVLGLDAAEVRELRPGEYVLDVTATPELIAALAAWLRDRHITLGELHAGRGSLEDVFLRLTSEDRP